MPPSATLDAIWTELIAQGKTLGEIKGELSKLPCKEHQEEAQSLRAAVGCLQTNAAYGKGMRKGVAAVIGFLGGVAALVGEHLLRLAFGGH
jgi:hypothetical protein